MSENLAHSLLRLSSAGLPIILSGRTLKDHLGPALERALGRRVLVELPRLDECHPAPAAINSAKHVRSES